MKKNRKVHQRSGLKGRKASPFVVFLIVNLCVVVVSLGVAWIWQTLDPVDYIEPTDIPHNTLLVQQEEERMRAEELAAQSSQATPQPNSVTEALDNFASSSYFDDAVFIGDSITEGIKLYDVMSNTTVLSDTGVNLSSIYTRKNIKVQNGEDITIIDAYKNLGVTEGTVAPTKTYILMGINSMFLAKEDFIAKYQELIEALQVEQPQSTIYVQSILPVTDGYQQRRPEFANSIIDDYNAGLIAMCEEMDIVYLDVASVFKDENGNLPTDASSDGLHFTASWYSTWFDYLRKNTVDEE